jgi:hypothetical protein
MDIQITQADIDEAIQLFLQGKKVNPALIAFERAMNVPIYQVSQTEDSFIVDENIQN